MKIFYTESFRTDFKNLPQEVKERAKRKLEIFTNNPHHPSLRVKKMVGCKNLWEGSITMQYRFVFTIEKDTAILYRIGTHDILKKV